MVGNFIADHIKGNYRGQYPISIERGIELHHQIDAFTDSHPITREIRNTLFKNHRHYSNVIVDMFYDHFLAKNFDNFSSKSLTEFIFFCEKNLEPFIALFPISAERYFLGMKKYNWMNEYKSIEGLHHILNLMGQRTNYQQLKNATFQLEQDYSYYETCFFIFFETLQHKFNLEK